MFIPDDGKWKLIAENIDHEAWLVHDLNSCSNYQFRLLAMNKIGWSIPGFPTNNVTTKLSGEYFYFKKSYKFSGFCNL